MGIMDDVRILPLLYADGSGKKIDLVMDLVESVNSGFTTGGGFSINGLISGLVGKLAYFDKNAFGRKHEVNVSCERNAVNTTFGMMYTDPWIDGTDKCTSKSVFVQNSISSGALVHGNVPHNRSNPTFEFLTAGLDISLCFRPNWRGMAGVILQRAGARDEYGRYLTEDCYGSPLTASGNTNDHMLVSKLEAEYYDSGTRGSSNILFNVEQGLPIMPSWLCFNKVNARARKEIELGFARLVLSLTGGHLVGSFPSHKAFAIGGTDSVRGYEEGAVGSGRSFVVGSAEVPIPIVKTLEGVIFADYGSDLGSGPMVPDDPAGTRLKPGNGYAYGTGVHWHSPLGLLRFEYAFNGKDAGRFHFGIGKRI